MSTAKTGSGKFGELYAAEMLKTGGYAIIAANYRSRYGEIDIIAKNGQYIVFVEVKTRSESAIARPAAWVDSRKQQKLIKTALMYLSENQTELQPRFDVIEIVTERGRHEVRSYNHIKNAFLSEGL